MRRLLLTLIALSACDRDPGPPPSPEPAPPPPTPVAMFPAAPADRLAVVRGDGVWTVNADGSAAAKLAPKIAQAAEPAWSPDRRWIAFCGVLDPENSLYPRNVFIARPDGSEFRRITPFPIRGGEARSRIRGRAVWVTESGRRPLPGLRVVAGGQGRVEATDAEGQFQIWAPTGVGWVKLTGTVDGRDVAAWRFIAGAEGFTSDLKDVPLSFGGVDVPGAPAWTTDHELIYLLRQASGSSIRRVKIDGVGDESLVTFTTTSVIAGPVARGGFAWVKMSDGSILQIDLKTRAAATFASAGLCAPDTLAVSPKGDALATLAMDATGARSILLVRKDGTETVVSFKSDEPTPRAVDFSPDGARLVYDRHGGDGTSSLWILTLSTKQSVRVPEAGAHPVWNGR